MNHVKTVKEAITYFAGLDKGDRLLFERFYKEEQVDLNPMGKPWGIVHTTSVVQDRIGRAKADLRVVFPELAYWVCDGKPTMLFIARHLEASGELRTYLDSLISEQTGVDSVRVQWSWDADAKDYDGVSGVDGLNAHYIYTP